MSKAEELRNHIMAHLEQVVDMTAEDPNRVMGGIIVAITPELDALVTMAEQNQGQQGVFNGGVFINNRKENPK